MNAPLLLKLASHLEGQLFYEWNFRRFRIIKETAASACKTCGCAIGELGAILKAEGQPELDALLEETLKTHSHRINADVGSKARDLLGLSEDEFDYLFIPFEGLESSASYLTGLATPQQVAALIRDFVVSNEERRERSLYDFEADEDNSFDGLSNDI